MRVGQVRKRDENEAEIVKALRKVGVYVFLVSGPGAPDLVCHYRKQWYVMEIKKPGKGRLTDAQLNTRAHAPFPIVETIEQAFQVFGIG